jgi:hypothetical protein
VNANKVFIVDRMKENKLRCLGHVERMDEDRLTKNVYDAEKQGARKRARPRMRWIDHLETILWVGKVPSTRRKRVRMNNLMNMCEAKSIDLHGVRFSLPTPKGMIRRDDGGGGSR